MPHYKDEKTNEIYFYGSEKNKKNHSKFLKTPAGKKLGFDLELKTISDKERLKITNLTLTTKQRITEIRVKYDKEIQIVCVAHLFNNINSARNLSTLTDSPLRPIAKKITDWELKQQAVFIKLLYDAKKGITKLNASTFDDNFVDFNESDKTLSKTNLDEESKKMEI